MYISIRIAIVNGRINTKKDSIMTTELTLLIVIYGTIATALFFDFVNGFHDSANAIATIVGTRVLKPIQAVAVAAIGNLFGPFIFGTAVAATVGKGIIQPEFSTVSVIFAGLIGAIIWDLITWYFRLPSSSSHALVGGLIGSALAVGGINAIVQDGVGKTLLFMIISPILGFLAAFGFTIILRQFLLKSNASKVNRFFGKLQIASSLFYSLTHGANDGQKTMGVITALLIAGGFLHSKAFVVPTPVILVAASAIALGTFFGGWRIVKTMAFGLTKLKPYQGFCAETAGGILLTSMAWLGVPVSTTHAISGAIMGTGATKRLSAVRWGIGKRIVYAWIITIPASASIGFIVFLIIKVVMDSG
jgi:inorganic phosphate transporter, PiT family